MRKIINAVSEKGFTMNGRPDSMKLAKEEVLKYPDLFEKLERHIVSQFGIEGIPVQMQTAFGNLKTHVLLIGDCLNTINEQLYELGLKQWPPKEN